MIPPPQMPSWPASPVPSTITNDASNGIIGKAVRSVKTVTIAVKVPGSEPPTTPLNVFLIEPTRKESFGRTIHGFRNL